MAFLLVLGALDHAKIITVSLLWSIWLDGILLLMTLGVVYFARRAIWLCLLRAAFLGILLLSMGTSGLILTAEVMPPGSGAFLALGAAAVFAVCVVLARVNWTVPYWKLTFAQNTARKIDLQTGVYSVTTEWATRPGESLSHRHFIFSLIPLGGTFLILLSQSLASTPWQDALIGTLSLGMFAGAAACEAETYFAYKLLELERQIGKPIVMDGYQRENA